MSQHSSRSRSTLTAVIWITAGAATGVLVGAALADRFGGEGRAWVRRARRWMALLVRAGGAIAAQSANAGRGRRAASAFAPGDDTGDDTGGARDFTDYVSPEVAFDPDLDDEEDLAADDFDDDGLGDEVGDDDDGERLDARVLAAFEQDPILSARAIEIDAPEPGIVTLAGRVPSNDDVRHAVTIARGVPGVVEVENHLRVRRARAAPRPTPAV